MEFCILQNLFMYIPYLILIAISEVACYPYFSEILEVKRLAQGFTASK